MSIQDQISSLLGDHNAEHKRLVQYVVEQLGTGRSLEDCINDPYVTNRLAPVQRCALVEEPEIVHAAQEESLNALRAQLAELADS
jgi:hypothetical protein